MKATERATSFLKDVRVESRKITYPTRKELRESTMVVIITVTVVSLFTGVVDRIFGFLLSRVLH